MLVRSEDMLVLGEVLLEIEMNGTLTSTDSSTSTVASD